MASWPRCRYPAEMPVLTWRLAAAAAAASGLVLLLPVPAPWGLLAVDGALLLAALVDWLLAARPAELEVVRELPGIVSLGTQARIAWTVAYRRDAARRTGRPLRVRLADELAPSLRAATRRARVVLVPGGRASAATSIRPERRGRFTPGEMVVRVDGPLGLVARQGRRRLEGVLRVYPPFHSRDEAELRINKARILEVGLRSAQGRGGGTEFDSLREYGVDDEFRRMDWAATARANKPIVRTYRAERNQTVLLLLDAGRTMAGLVAGVPRLEHAMDAVMMLTAVATRLGDRAGMVAFDSEVRAMVGAGHAADRAGPSDGGGERHRSAGQSVGDLQPARAGRRLPQGGRNRRARRPPAHRRAPARPRRRGGGRAARPAGTRPRRRLPEGQGNRSTVSPRGGSGATGKAWRHRRGSGRDREGLAPPGARLSAPRDRLWAPRRGSRAT